MPHPARRGAVHLWTRQSWIWRVRKGRVHPRPATRMSVASARTRRCARTGAGAARRGLTMWISRHRRSRAGTAVLGLQIATGILVVVYFASTVFRVRNMGSSFYDGWIDNLGYGGCVVLCAWRAVTDRQQRLAWAAITLSLVLFTAGTVLYTTIVQFWNPVPYPSIADAFWLLFYPVAYTGVGLLIRASAPRGSGTIWLDGIIAALGVAALASVLVIVHISDGSRGSFATAATNLAYPVGDLVLIMMLVVVFVMRGWQPGAPWWTLGAGFGIFALADTVYVLRVTSGTYVTGTPLDSLWLIGTFLIAIAAWQQGDLRWDPAGRQQPAVVPAPFLLSSLSIGAVGPAGPLARLGGDEFVVIVAPRASVADATGLADRIGEALGGPLPIAGMSLQIDASIGIAVCPKHGTTAEVLLQKADVAMYEAKRNHRCWELYASDRDIHTRQRFELLADLPAALTRGELVLHYQPKLDLATGTVLGLEALVRWQHPVHGLLFPDRFIGLAEHTGLIDILTMTILDQALTQQAQWSHGGLDLDIAVNVSATSLRDGGLSDKIAALLLRRGVPPSRLTIEIPEGSLMADPDLAIRLLGRLKQLGVRISVDDYGTGFASLASLRELPVDELKLDQSFLIGVPGNAKALSIVRSTIELAHALGLQIVTEGVETQDTLELVAALGCDAAQGYFIGRPASSADLSGTPGGLAGPVHWNRQSRWPRPASASDRSTAPHHEEGRAVDLRAPTRPTATVVSRP